MSQEFDHNTAFPKTSIEDNLVRHSNERDPNDVNLEHVAQSQLGEESSTVTKSQSDEESSEVAKSSIDKQPIRKLRILGILILFGSFAILIAIINALSKYDHYLYEIITNPESESYQIIISGQLYYIVVGVKTFLMAAIIFIFILAFGLIPADEDIKNPDPACFLTDEISQKLFLALTY